MPKFTNYQFASKLLIAAMISVSLISCDGESSSNVSEDITNDGSVEIIPNSNGGSSSSSGEASVESGEGGNLTEFECSGGAVIIIDGENVCEDQ